MFSLPNLVSKAVVPCEPWSFTSSSIPPEVKGKEGKKERDRWINNPATKHQVYSAFEGFIAAQRISEGKGADEGNPPFKLYAFVLDIDSPVTEQELLLGIGRMGDTVPNYFERTLSGNARLIWLFEKPVAFPNRRFAVEFLKRAFAQFRFEQVAAGVDLPAFMEPNRYYTNSGEWLVVDAAKRIPYAVLQGLVVEVSEKHLWRKDRGAVDIPLPAVLAELEKKWPNHGWPGDFVEGSQGPSFWIDGSASPKSAIVKPTGLFTFSSHAVKPFYDWADLLGIQFVEKYKTEMMGKAVEGIYHDGTKYYRKDGYGEWKYYTKEDIASHLNVDRGLSSVKDQGSPSEVARAIQFIQNWQGVVGAAPFVFQPTGLVQKSGNRFLNTHTRRPLSPSGEPTVWGPEGNMPFLSKFFDGIFHPESKPVRPRDYYLSWLSRFYRGAYEMRPESGQNVFMLGAPGVGKTLLSQGILARLMGGAADAEDYLLGTTQFNSELFEVGLWNVDDNSANVDVTTHRKFSAMVKKMAANTTFAYHAKFRVPCAVDWLGRVVVTANADEESARIVPDLSISILDKLSLYRTADVSPVVYPAREQLLKTLEEELPRFARFLLDYQIPEHCLGTSRFGIKAYHDEELLRLADQSSATASFVEILEHWAAVYFEEHPDKNSWVGTAYGFTRELSKDPHTVAAGVRSLTPLQVSRMLAAVHVKRMFSLAPVPGKATSRLWKIDRPGAEPVMAAEPIPAGTSFSK